MHQVLYCMKYWNKKKNLFCNISNTDLTNSRKKWSIVSGAQQFLKAVLGLLATNCLLISEVLQQTRVILGKLSSFKKHPLDFTLAFIVNQNYIGLLVACISLLIGSLHYSFWRCNIIFLRGKWDLSELIQMVVKSKPGKLDFFCFIRKV